MTKVHLSTFEAAPGAEDFSNPLSEVLGLQAPLLKMAIAFDESFEKDDAAAAQALACIQVQVFTRIVGLLRKMMRPFIRLNREIYSRLPELSEDEEIEIGVNEEDLDLTETKLFHLEAIPRLSSFRYHLCGVIDALNDVKRYALALEASYGLDDEAASSAISSLQVHLFFHLPYHLKKLRRPFIRLNHEIYAKLDEEPYLEDD